MWPAARCLKLSACSQSSSVDDVAQPLLPPVCVRNPNEALRPLSNQIESAPLTQFLPVIPHDVNRTAVPGVLERNQLVREPRTEVTAEAIGAIDELNGAQAC